MSQTISINIPSSLQDIKLGQYQKYIKDVQHLTEKDNPTAEEVEFSNLKLLECFCDVSLKEAYKLPMTEFSYIITHINELFNQKSSLHNKFNMIDPDGNNITFGFIPKLEDISLGEFVDLEKYIGDWQQMHKAMAVLYRPTKHQKNEFYLIEDYEGSDKYAEVMKDSPIQAALGATVFLQFREGLVETFDGLFTETTEGGFGLSDSFGAKWGWYQSIYALAKGDVRQFEEVTRLPISQCLTWLEFEKEKNELENKMIKQKTR